MNKLIALIAAVLISIQLFAQAPQKMSYQAVIRNASNNLVTNAQVKMRISILQGSTTGAAVYSELHSATTNANGLASIEIGEGTNKTGAFSTINWGNGTYFLKTETDPNNGSTYSIVGTSQLLSVPYALYAANGFSNGTANNQIMYWNGISWVTLNPGSNGQTLTICNGILKWTTGGICLANITALNCSTATNNGTLTAGTAASGVNSVVPYTGGNGGTYPAQSIGSTGVTGLIATLAGGTLASGTGNLTYIINGTPATSGTASFALSIGGQSCMFTRTVEATDIGIINHSCGATNVHNPTVPYGRMTDQEGNEYRTVQIGSQIWMAENLKTTRYRNGIIIPEITNPDDWANNTIGGYCSYNNNTSNDCPYGKLYNWYAVNNTNQLCPKGWHVPTDAEWNILIANLDPSYNPTADGSQSAIAGGKMKSTGTQYWQSPNQDATNSSGWSGLSGGYRYDQYGTFNSIGTSGIWWSSTEYRISWAWYRTLVHESSMVNRLHTLKTYGFSVRCVKD